jgi:hypothetical protein
MLGLESPAHDKAYLKVQYNDGLYSTIRGKSAVKSRKSWHEVTA